VTRKVLIEPDETAATIRAYLSAHPELLKDAYAHEDRDPLHGLCYPAAEAYYHATGRQHDIYCLSWSDVDDDLDGTHWYLREADGERRWIDLALPAEPKTLPPFEVGRRRHFLTGDDPSQRAQQVLDETGVAP
jgi:hypothetical protein